MSSSATAEDAQTEGVTATADDTEAIKQWAVYVTGLFAIYGLVSIVDSLLITEVFDVSFQGMTGTSWRTELLPLLIAVAVAVYTDLSEEDLYRLLGAGVAVAVVVMALVETTLTTELLLDQGELDVAVILQYAIAEVVSSVLVVVAAVWLTRNHLPDDLVA